MALVADLLTVSRFLIAALLLMLGWAAGERGFRQAIALILAGWTSDIADGNFARKSSVSTRFGHLDFPSDFTMTLAGFGYLYLSGFVAPVYFFGYSAFLLFIYFFYRSQSLTMIFLCPITFLPFLIAYYHDPMTFLLSVVWAVVFLIIDFRRFLNVIIEFAENFPGGFLVPVGEKFRKLESIIFRGS